MTSNVLAEGDDEASFSPFASDEPSESGRLRAEEALTGDGSKSSWSDLEPSNAPRISAADVRDRIERVSWRFLVSSVCLSVCLLTVWKHTQLCLLLLPLSPLVLFICGYHFLC